MADTSTPSSSVTPILEPPPRVTGNSEQDQVALTNWVGKFYEAAIVQGGLATAASVANAVDPSNATAATAQATANAAQTLAQKSDTTLSTQEGGKATISGASATVDVILTTTQPDANYFVVCSVSGTSGSPSGGATLQSITKTKTKFTITLNAAPGAGTSLTFDWHLRR